jgi:DNA-binding protein H-NS
MSQTYKELLAQRAALEQAIAQARHKEIAHAVARVREMIEEFGLTVQDVFPGRTSRASGRSTGKVAPKYRDPATGQTWTGRGKPPKWIDGQNREQFLIG